MTNANQKIILKGVGASAGMAQGKVKVIKDSKERTNFNEGEILVTKITDPSMVMLMSQAAAIVTDIGGLTSHPAIVSREMGIPCVVATKTATTDLIDGMEILVNGSTGEIFITEQTTSEISTERKNETENKYSQLIDAYRQAFATMDQKTFEETTDYTKLDPLIADSWIAWLLNLIKETKKQKLTSREIAELLHTPNTLRNTAIFDLFMASCAKLDIKTKKEIADFYINALEAICIKDPFSKNGHNVTHGDEEIINLLNEVKPANQQIAKKIGRLVNACYHIGYSLFGDMNPNLVYENYGPYYVTKDDGKEYLLVIKEFKNIKPIEFWPETSRLPFEKITVVCLYENVKFSIDAITHTNYQGDIINGLKYFTVYIDNQIVQIEQVEKATNTLEKYSDFIWHIFKEFSDEDYKKTYLHQKAYIYINLCRKLGLEWRPNKELLNEISNKPLKTWQNFKTAQEKDEFFLSIIDPTTNFSG